jgi:hypothetical protein
VNVAFVFLVAGSLRHGPMLALTFVLGLALTADSADLRIHIQ